jgi:hypothetical protein
MQKFAKKVLLLCALAAPLVAGFVSSAEAMCGGRSCTYQDGEERSCWCVFESPGQICRATTKTCRTPDGRGFMRCPDCSCTTACGSDPWGGGLTGL